MNRLTTKLIAIACIAIGLIMAGHSIALAAPVALSIGAADGGGISGLIFQLVGDYGGTAITILLAGIGWIVGKLLKHFLDKGYTRETLGRAWDAIRTATAEVAQTYVDGIRKGSSDGKLTGREKTEAKNRALKNAKSYLGAKGLKKLGKVLGLDDVDEWLGGQIESAVRDQKLTDAAVAGP